jgi:hypothetical protein
MTEPKTRKRSNTSIILVILALLLLFLIQWKLKTILELNPSETGTADSLQIQDSIRRTGALWRADSLRLVDSVRRVDSVRVADSLARLEIMRRQADSLALSRGRSRGEFAAMWKAREDSLQAVKDSLVKVQDSLDFAENTRLAELAKHLEDSVRTVDSLQRADSIALVLRNADKTPPQGDILLPSGRYYEDQALRIACKEPKCQVFVSVGDTSNPRQIKDPLPITKSGKVWWRVVDSLGNAGAWQLAEYDLATDQRCGKNAYPVPLGKRTVCIDVFEYPNRAEELPKDMVTQEEASRLCAKDGKRLCTLEEWQSGCHGKDKSKYPYGGRYDQTRCATAQAKVERVGRKEGCRSWWGMFDMAGNLWEWTSTPNAVRPAFFDVAGGSWNTQDESACTSTKFSFYPQNQYPFVGFRCCVDSK